jgi:hypothetical protein
MRTRFLLLAALAVAACDRKPATPAKTASVSEALPSLILPANASFVSRSGSEDALSVVLRTPQKVEQVADYYRSVLTRAPWKLEGDVKDREGAVALYATREGPPLWVRIWPDTEFNATLVQLTGAVVKDLKLDDRAGTQIAPGGQPPQ